jgi:ABC-type nitrate/sulfonate/bicarbonate transport system substrate-binding protein
MRLIVSTAAAILLGTSALLAPPPANAVETITAGAVGSSSTTIWPVYIGIRKGFFDAVGIKVDPVYAQSSTAIAQQVAAGSINLTVGSGLVDPIRAIEKGAPIAIWRIDMQAPPYALLAKPAIKTIKELKGKTIMIGGGKDITRIFVERMLVPNGVKPNEVDYVFAGATSARLSALQSGAVDASILTSPHNFYAEAAGFSNLGWTVEYAKDLPFSGGAVNRAWAAANKPTLDKFLDAYNKSVNWFQDTKNRDEAVKIMADVSKLKQDEVEKSYDFLQKGNFYELTGKISKTTLGKLVEALQELGDLPPSFKVEQLLMPGVAELTN